MADENGPVTLKEIIDERNEEEDEKGHPEHQPAQEVSGPDIEKPDLDEDTGSILTASPDSLFDREDSDGFPQIPTSPGDGEEGDGGAIVLPPGATGGGGGDDVVNVDFSSMEEVLNSIDEDVSDDSTRELLAKMLQTQRVGVQAQANILSTLIDLLEVERPFRSVAVSGINTIDQSEEGQSIPVVPQSDNTNIPTRILIIRASQSNSDPIAFGDDEVKPDDGFLLSPGTSISLEMSLANLTLWMGGTAGDEVELLGLM